MFHVYKLGRRGCIALVNDFDRFRDDDEPIVDESVRYAEVCVERWSSFDDMAPACVAKDAEVLHECYETGFELFIS